MQSSVVLGHAGIQTSNTLINIPKLTVKTIIKKFIK